MTKKDIIRTVHEGSDIDQKTVQAVVQMLLDKVLDAIATDRRLELRDFGVFEVRKRAARPARNPRSGEAVEVPEKYVVTFSPGKEMQQRINDAKHRKAGSPNSPD